MRSALQILLPDRINADRVGLAADKVEAGAFEGETELRFRCPMDTVPAAFVIANGAARHAGSVRQIGLRPIKKTACGATERRRQ